MAKKKLSKKLFKPAAVLPMLLQFHRSSIESEVDAFKEYIIDNRHSIKKQQKEFNKMVEDEIKLHPGNEHEISEWYEDQYSRYNDFYPAIFNNSTLLSVYSYFEFNLKRLCITLQNHKKHLIKLDDFGGQNYIDKSRKYIKLVEALDISSLDNTWQKITKYQNVRNCVVHNNSNIIKNKDLEVKKQPLYQILKTNPHLKLNEGNGTFIINDDQYLLDFCDIISEYLVEIIKKLEANK